MRKLMYSSLWCVSLLLVAVTLNLAYQCVFADRLFIDQYDCVITNPEKQVYDGDTLKDVRVLLLEKDFEKMNYGEYWPGVHITARGIEIETDIRINGIDTPEKRVSTKNADGTKRSEASRTRERNASYAARDALIKLLENNNGRFTIANPEHGKYAGRTVASVHVGDKNVALWLIGLGHAIYYDGGKKVPFDVWYQRDKKQAPKAPSRVPAKPPADRGKGTKINK